MKRVDTTACESEQIGTGSVRCRLADRLGTEGVALNRYRLAPGDGLPGGLHAHGDQEEVFLVVEGVVTFETLDGSRAVAAGEAVRFAPGEFQSGRNESRDPAVVYALGAPRETTDTRIPVGCPDCPAGELRLVTTDAGLRFDCPGCGRRHVPRDCPDCGSDRLRITRGTGRGTYVVCERCGAEYDNPPTE